jgi:amino acid adenylation domain-containing protein/FkbH-like protein
MNETIQASARLHDDSGSSTVGSMAGSSGASRGVAQGTEPARTIAIAATFTADLLLRPLEFWMRTLQIPAEVELAPYAQIMQQLLSADSTLNRNATGCNVLVIRLDDWVRDRLDEPVESNLKHLEQASRGFIKAVDVYRGRNGAATLVFLCPASSSLPPEYQQPIESIRRELSARLETRTGVYCCDHAELVRLYPIDDYEDAIAEKVGHIPYTKDYFAAMATLLARRVAALLKPRIKVIAVDCDNTLWQGVCGEDGPEGIRLTSAHLEVQRMLIRQHDAGALLCLCSKNNPDDVAAVFRDRPDMLLREEHVIGSRVNWEPKSANLRSLAQELGLSLDSFMFIDDSAVECAEVAANCPSVLTLQLPSTEAEVRHWLDHVWAFDRIGVTDEARRRTEQYRQNRARARALEQATDLEQFLASLDLQVTVAAPQPQHLARVAELTQRTNQFNLTTIRYSASDVDAMWRSGDAQLLVVHVKDRFGDYGLVGVVIYRVAGEKLDVDTFLLSCRVLGRGVEHRIVNELGRIAQRAGASVVRISFRPTPRNVPARAFVDQQFGRFRVAGHGGKSADQAVFEVPSEYAVGIKVDGERETASVIDDVTPASPVDAGQNEAVHGWHLAALRLSRLADLVKELDQSTSRQRHGVSTEYVEPATSTEAAVAAIWGEVLGLEAVGANDDFFELGGDSLMAVQAISRIGSVLGLELTLEEFFEAPVVAKVATRLADASKLNARIERLEHAGRSRLSSAQLRLWFTDQIEGENSAYTIPLCVRMKGELDLDALRAALDAIVERHEVLRTTFPNVNGEPMQVIVQRAQFALQVVDLRGLDVPGHGAQAREGEVLREMRQELATHFDLSAGPLIRGKLLQLSADEHVLLITMHHIISDGWSLGVLIRELGALYAAQREGRGNPLPALSIQYADYAAWHWQSLSTPRIREQLEYWRECLATAPELLELPTDWRRPAVQSHRGDAVRVALGGELTAELKAFARRHNLTPAMLLFAGWWTALSRLSGQRDIVIGMPVANRRSTQLEELIGFFVNTLAVRVTIEEDMPVAQFLARVRQALLGAYAHQDVPFEQVVEALQPPRSLSHSPIFQVAFAYQNAPRSALQLPGLTLVEQDVPVQSTQFDLTLSLQETADEISGTLAYASDLFEAASVERFVSCLVAMLSAIVREPDALLGRLPLMSGEQRLHIVRSLNATKSSSLPGARLVHEIFEKQVERTPDAPAVTCEGRSLTYAQLNRRANQLAWYLKEQGVRIGECVAVVMPRCTQLLITQLAILKCGGIYLPIDPALPEERLIFMIRDSAAGVVVTNGTAPDVLSHTGVRCIDCAGNAAAIDSLRDDNPGFAIGPAPAAYVMYTSGSTGTPKGVVVPHAGVVRLAIDNGYAKIEPADCIAHHSNPTFDASTFEVWGALLNGAQVIIIPQAVALEARDFAAALLEQRVSILYMSVGLFNQYVDALAEVFRGLRYLIVGGDALDVEIIRRVLQTSRPQHLLNGYGPTECTTFTTTHLIDKLDERATSIPIGRPISNTQVYILDERREAVPLGVVGEIYVGGAGVACGYLNRPDLTAERFVPDPFGSDPAARLYKTGDLGRWRNDGTIEFLGRNDHQVKIRGFRVELGEIESHLMRHEAVAEAVVMMREDGMGDRRLVAYVTARGERPPAVDELRSDLKRALPEYMIPSAFVILDQLPLTPTGKLDRRALPAPSLAAYANREYVAPSGATEETLAAIWKDLLRVERVGREDNFFELGGHSLLAMQVTAHVQGELGLEVPVRSLFECPTLAAFAARVEELRDAALIEKLAHADDLLEEVATMPESRVRALLDSLSTTMDGARS